MVNKQGYCRYCHPGYSKEKGILPILPSHFNYFLLDGSIGSIPFSLLYPGWQYRQYPCLFTISWMAVSAVSLFIYHILDGIIGSIIFNYYIFISILFLEFIYLLLGKNSSF